MVPELIQLLHCNLTKIKIKTVYFSNTGSRSLYRVWAPALWLKPRWDPLPLPLSPAYFGYLNHMYFGGGEQGRLEPRLLS